MKTRVGLGSDIHKLEKGKSFSIGGIKIPHDKGAVGHSDADVLIHAICDALLGAANLRDIGFHFPDTSSELKNIDSKILLKKVAKLLKDKGYRIINIDSIINLQKPKISTYIPDMQKVLSLTMGIKENDISIKAKTSENLGFIGREEGVSAQAVALIASND